MNDPKRLVRRAPLDASGNVAGRIDRLTRNQREELDAALAVVKRVVVRGDDGKPMSKHIVELESTIVRLSELGMFSVSGHAHLDEVALRSACWEYGVSANDTPQSFLAAWEAAAERLTSTPTQSFSCLYAMPIRDAEQLAECSMVIESVRLSFERGRSVADKYNLPALLEELRRDDGAGRPPAMDKFIYASADVPERDDLAAGNRVADALDQVRGLLNFLLVRHVYASSSPRYMSAAELRIAPVSLVTTACESQPVPLFGARSCGRVRTAQAGDLDFRGAGEAIRAATTSSDECGSGRVFLRALSRYQAGLDAENSEAAFLFYYQSIEILLSGGDQVPQSETLRARIGYLLSGNQDKALLYGALQSRRHRLVHKGLRHDVDAEAAVLAKLLAEECIDRFYRFVKRQLHWNDVRCEMDLGKCSSETLATHRRALDRILESRLPSVPPGSAR